MDDVEVVQVAYALKEILEENGYFLLFERPLVDFPLLEQRFQGAPSDELHLDDQILLSLVKGVELNYVFVVHRLQYFSFLGKQPQS